MPDTNLRCLSGNTLKIIAAVAMFLDHMGMLLFPENLAFRYVGRLAFPIFAFMIAEGCRYTRNRLRYWGGMTSLAAVCQIVYFLFDGSLYLCILVTFSLAVLTIYALDRLKGAPNLLNALIFLSCVAGVYVLNQLFTIDYGFWGCMAPVFASVPRGTKYDTIPLRVALLGLALLPLSTGVQFYALFALPLLLCYSGKRGKYRMKYFFYLFYPLHLAALEGIALLIK